MMVRPSCAVTAWAPCATTSQFPAHRLGSTRFVRRPSVSGPAFCRISIPWSGNNFFVAGGNRGFDGLARRAFRHPELNHHFQTGGARPGRLQPDGGVHASTERLNYGKAKPASFPIAMVGQTIEAFKDPFAVFFRNARAVVLDLKGAKLLGNANDNVAAGRTVADRVIQQIGDHLSRKEWAAQDIDTVIRSLKAQLHPGTQRFGNISPRDGR